MTKRSTLALGALALTGCAGAGLPAPAAAPPLPDGEYVAYVASESADQVSRIRFGAGGARVERQVQVGNQPTEIDGPHGLAISPDGQYFYVSIAHGTPYGTLQKFSTATGELVERTTLGLFPATVGVTPDGDYAFVTNFNLHGDHVPSSVSKVHLPSLTEVARTETCVMPHGSRINPQGTRQYSTCMMDQKLVEIDVASGEVSRTLELAPAAHGGAHAGHAAARVCSPTWAQPSADGSKVYVACNKAAEIVEVDVASWRVTRRFATGEAPYNLDVTPDGRYLLVTLKNRTAPATEVIDLSAGATVARVPSSGVLPHGVAVTPDSRFAVVSVEGIGSEPGRVDVIDLGTLRRVGSVEVGPQAGGIAVLAGR
jgi:DNA-binding beta-propeller fold protein YncE